MSCNNEKSVNVNDELSKVNLSLHESSIELWRSEEKCSLKKKSINEIENSTTRANMENMWLEKQIQDTKSRTEEVRENIVSYDRILLSLYDTLAHLDIENEKKEFSINKSKNDYELQLFIRMELWQKEEERLDNIPEVKSLKNANSELNKTILEYEELLDCKNKLMKNIKKAEEQNDKKLNDMVVKFAKLYVETLSLNKREENCKTILSELNTEYHKKLNMKNTLLESKRKKVNKISFWKQTLCPFDSKMLDIKLDSLNTVVSPKLKSTNFRDFSNTQNMNIKEVPKSSKPRRNVTFLSPSEDPISDSNYISNECKNSNFVESNSTNNNNMHSNSAFMKDVSVVNMNTPQQYPKNGNEKLINESDIDFQTNKRKRSEAYSDFKFKKPLNPEQDENQKNRNIIKKTFQQSTTTNENIHMENNGLEHPEKVLQFLGKEIHLQKNNALKSAEQSNVKIHSHDNNNIFELQSNETSFCEPNNAFSAGLFWNESNEQSYLNSTNNSYCGSDLSEFLGNSNDSFYEQFPPDVQVNPSTSLNTNSIATAESNLQESKIKTPQKSGNSVFQPLDERVKGTTLSASNYVTDPIRPHFVTSEQFRFNFI